MQFVKKEIYHPACLCFALEKTNKISTSVKGGGGGGGGYLREINLDFILCTSCNHL